MKNMRKPRSCETALVISRHPNLAPVGSEVWMTPEEAHLMLLIGHATLPQVDADRQKEQRQDAPAISGDDTYRRKYRRYDHREMRSKK